MFESGKFFVGCNYWASHAGIYMWRNWDAEQVEKDLATLEKNGLHLFYIRYKATYYFLQIVI